MDKFTEVRQTLGKCIWNLIKKYGDKLTVTLVVSNNIQFYAKHYGADEKYVIEMGWEYSNGDGLMAVRQTFHGPEDAVSQRTSIEDMERAFDYMAVVETFMEIEADRQGIEVE